jgi:exopolysaccharide production protein ExoZ
VRRYLHGLDLMRIVASAAVVYAHTRDWFTSGHESWWVNGVLNTAVLNPLRLGALMAPLAVITFFVISGLVVTYAAQKESPGRFLARRFVRIVPALWVVLIAVWVLTRLGVEAGVHGENAGAVSTLLANMTLLNFTTGSPGLDLVTWTLTAQVAFYVIVSVTIPLLRRWPWLPPALTWALLSVLMSLVRSENSAATHTLRVIVTLLPVMFIGQAIALAQLGKLHPLAALVYACGYWLVIVRGDLTSDFTPAVPGYPQMVVCIALLTIICGRLTGGVVGARWVKALADRTYAVFLLHVPVLYLTPHLVSTQPGTTLAFTVAMVGTAVTADLLYRFVEKPAVRWWRSWENRGRNSAERARDDLAGRVEATR